MIQQSNLLLISDWYNKLLCYYNTTDTTISQYYTPIDTKINMLVNTPTLIQQPTTVLYLNWFSKLLCSYNDLNTMILDTAISTTTIQQWLRTLSMTARYSWYRPLINYSTNDITILILNNLDTTTTYSAI